MPIEVVLSDGPLPRERPECPPQGAGAVLCFEGLVRPLEDGRPIQALDYEVYEPMAQDMLKSLGQELAHRHGLLGMCIEHSRGRVGVGQCSFRLQVASAHRQQALAALAEFINRMKQDVPIWKTPAWRVDSA